MHAALAGRTDKAVHGVGLVLDRERDRLACAMEVVYVHVAAALDAEVGAHPWVAGLATGLSLRR